MRLLLDTQILVWLVIGDRRLRPAMRQAIEHPDATLQVSAIVAFEYADLQARKRIPLDEPLDELVDRFDLVIEGFPAECWRIAAELPDIHRDPVDRMLIAHAIANGLTLVTADRDIRRYPVETIW